MNGTRSTALALNTSYVRASYRRRETPLGPRWSIYGHTATGQKRELAMVADEPTAGRVTNALEIAMKAMARAAELIADDREGR